MRRLVVAEDAQDVIEYALLAGLISLVAVAVILNVGTGVNTVWTGVDSTMGSIPTPKNSSRRTLLPSTDPVAIKGCACTVPSTTLRRSGW